MDRIGTTKESCRRYDCERAPGHKSRVKLRKDERLQIECTLAWLQQLVEPTEKLGCSRHSWDSSFVPSFWLVSQEVGNLGPCRCRPFRYHQWYSQFYERNFHRRAGIFACSQLQRRSHSMLKRNYKMNGQNLAGLEILTFNANCACSGRDSVQSILNLYQLTRWALIVDKIFG